MPKFSAVSKARLMTCHPELQLLFFEVVKYWDCTILEGHRTQEEQERAFKMGNTTKHYPNSKHNSKPSLAVDVMPYPLDWRDIPRCYYFSGFVLGMAESLYQSQKMRLKIRHGADWDSDRMVNDHQLIDVPHFELIVPE